MTGWPWPRPTDDGGARHLKRGLRIPEVALPSAGGGAVHLSTLPGRTALFIYPWTGRPGLANPPDWDDIPGAHGSTPELESIAKLHVAFENMQIRVLAVSSQSGDHHRELAGRLKLPFPLLSDSALALRTALRLPVFETGGVTYLKRLTLAISDGRIDYAFYPAHPPDAHPREVLAAMTAMSTYAQESRLKR